MFSFKRHVTFLLLISLISNNLHAVNAGILPVAKNPADNKCYVLLGKERSDFWSDFGGQADQGESTVDTAIREFGEETGYFKIVGNTDKLADLKERLTADQSVGKNYVEYIVRINYFARNKFKDITPTGKEKFDYVWIPIGIFHEQVLKQGKGLYHLEFKKEKATQILINYKGVSYNIRNSFKWSLRSMIFTEARNKNISEDRLNALLKNGDSRVADLFNNACKQEINIPPKPIKKPAISITPAKPTMVFKPAGILPYALYNNQCYFLLGQEKDETWSDFGGLADTNLDQDQIDVAIRQFENKTSYFKILFDQSGINLAKNEFKKQLQNNLINIEDDYVMFLAKISNYNPDVFHVLTEAKGKVKEKIKYAWILVDDFLNQFKEQKHKGSIIIKYDNQTYTLRSEFVDSFVKLLKKYNQTLKLPNCIIQKTQTKTQSTSITHKGSPRTSVPIPSVQSPSVWEKFLSLLEWLWNKLPSFS